MSLRPTYTELLAVAPALLGRVTRGSGFDEKALPLLASATCLRLRPSQWLCWCCGGGGGGVGMVTTAVVVWVAAAVVVAVAGCGV